VDDPEQPLVLGEEQLLLVGEVAEEVRREISAASAIWSTVVRSNPRSSNSSEAAATGETPQNA
jgi:hypothetical protein